MPHLIHVHKAFAVILYPFIVHIINHFSQCHCLMPFHITMSLFPSFLDYRLIESIEWTYCILKGVGPAGHIHSATDISTLSCALSLPPDTLDDSARLGLRYSKPFCPFSP